MIDNIIRYMQARLGIEHNDEGAAMVEYGLLVAFIALVALVGVTLLGTQLSTLFTNIANAL